MIVASDVTPTPSMVKKISSIFSSPVHELNESLSTEEKVALTKGGGYAYKNAHERDALAACVNAFRRYNKKFVQVQKKTPAGVDVEEVKALVIKGVSISAAINRLISVKEQKEKCTKEERQEEKKCDGDSENILRLRRIMKAKDEKIEMLEVLTTDLNAKVKEKELEITNLHAKLDSERSVRRREIEETEVISRKNKEIKLLREELTEKVVENADLREIIEELKGKREVKGGKRIKVIKSFSQKAIFEIDSKYELKKGDIVFLEDGSGGGASTAELLTKKGVAAVIYGKEMSHSAVDKFLDFCIPTLSTDELPLLLKEEGDFAFVDERSLNEKIKEWKRRKGKEEKVVFRL